MKNTEYDHVINGNLIESIAPETKIKKDWQPPVLMVENVSDTQNGGGSNADGGIGTP